VASAAQAAAVVDAYGRGALPDAAAAKMGDFG